MPKHESFNIEPGQSSWLDQSESYKKQYHAYFDKEKKKKAKSKLVRIPPKQSILPTVPDRSYKMPSLDVFITGSSRPLLWPLFWESYKKMCIIRGQHKVTVHEDFVFPAESNKVMKYLSGLQKTGEIQTVDRDKPAVGLGHSMHPYITKKLKGKYMFYIQEDWIFERPIDIDHILWVMENNPKINLIFFNKIRNDPTINHQKQPEYTYSGMKMCLYHGWTFLPGIWRMDFVKTKWQQGSIYKPEGNFTNTAFGGPEARANIGHCEQNIGAYIYGQSNEYRYVRHIGNDWRMAQWQLKRPGVPGGSHNSETMDKPYMAPWCLPYYIDGPTTRGDVSKR